MKVLFAAVYLFVLSMAEPPPSHSYLPPPPGGHRPGNFQGQDASSPSNPELIIARSLDAQGRGNPFARNGAHGHGAHGHGVHRLGDLRNGGDEKYGNSGEEYARNALEEVNEEPANYNFEYMVNDQFLGTEFGHQEERQDERAQGEYHVVLPDGRKQTVNYEADEHGFKPRVSYQDSDELASSKGYDSNAREIDAEYTENDYKNGGDYHRSGFRNGGKSYGNKNGFGKANNNYNENGFSGQGGHSNGY